MSRSRRRDIPFYRQLNEVLRAAGFDEFCERQCVRFYAERRGRPSLPPGVYFRLMLVGFFEGLDSERAIAWRAADSLSVREFLGYGLDEATPDHVTVSRTRRLIDGETHQRVFAWVLEQLARAGLIQGKTIGVDATTLEANAAMRSTVRRDTGESYQQYLERLAASAGLEAADPEVLQAGPECRMGEPARSGSPDQAPQGLPARGWPTRWRRRWTWPAGPSWR